MDVIELNSPADLVDFITAEVAMVEHGGKAQLPNGDVMNVMDSRGLRLTMRASRQAAEEMVAKLNVCWAISTLKWRYN